MLESATVTKYLQLKIFYFNKQLIKSILAYGYFMAA